MLHLRQANALPLSRERGSSAVSTLLDVPALLVGCNGTAFNALCVERGGNALVSRLKQPEESKIPVVEGQD
jgi:hypothetical protein